MPSATMRSSSGAHAIHSDTCTSWMCACSNSGFTLPIATRWNIQSR